MDPEDKYNIKYWKILKSLKDKILLSDHNLIEYKIYSGILIVGHDEPSQKEELTILKRIEKEGGIKIVGDTPNYTGLQDVRFDLFILQPTFDEIYDKYKNIVSKQNTENKSKISENFTGIKDSVIKDNTIIGGSLFSIESHHRNIGKKNSSWFSKLTNNQTFAVVIGGLLLLFIIYLIFIYSGVNLSSFDLQ